MTQCYKAVNIDKNEYLSPLSFNSGDNLMESCYVGNDFVNALTALLTGPWHGDRVMYIGSYALNDVVRGDRLCSGATLLRELKESGERDVALLRELEECPFVIDGGPYAGAESWHDAAEYCDVPETVFPAREGEIDCEEKRYVVNETQGVFYDRDKQGENYWYHLAQDPLLIFLAVGSGIGGGDYHSDVGAELIGSWACQTISASNERPEGLREIVSPFDPNA